MALTVCLLAGCSGTRPADLGVRNERLRPCPGKPNCVSSQAPRDDEEHFVAPLRYEGDAAAAMDRLVAILEDWSRMEVVTRTERYLHAEATSLIFRFVDDLELYLPEGEPGVIHCRSGSRLGYSDFGVNRSRVEELRERFTER